MSPRAYSRILAIRAGRRDGPCHGPDPCETRSFPYVEGARRSRRASTSTGRRRPPILESQSSSPTPRVFQLHVATADDEAREIRGRMAAIREAKRVSQDTSYPVRIERKDGGVLMSFHDGELVQYKRQLQR